MSYHDAMRFAVTVGFDALRIAIGREPVHHTVETVCAWLRHVDARRTGKAAS
jgi:hypothetical protein